MGPRSVAEDQILLSGRQTPEYAQGTDLPSIIGQREEFLQRSEADYS